MVTEAVVPTAVGWVAVARAEEARVAGPMEAARVAGPMEAAATGVVARAARVGLE